MADRKIVVTVSMDPALLETVDRYAAALGIRRSQLITNAIEAQLRTYDKLSDILANTISELKKEN